MARANSTRERVDILAAALTRWNNDLPASERHDPFDAAGNAARILNAVGRLTPEAIAATAPPNMLATRMRTEDNAASHDDEISRLPRAADGTWGAREAVSLREDSVPSARRAARPEVPRAGHGAGVRGGATAPPRSAFDRGVERMERDGARVHLQIDGAGGGLAGDFTAAEVRAMTPTSLAANAHVSEDRASEILAELRHAIGSVAAETRPPTTVSEISLHARAAPNAASVPSEVEIHRRPRAD